MLNALDVFDFTVTVCFGEKHQLYQETPQDNFNTSVLM